MSWFLRSLHRAVFQQLRNAANTDAVEELLASVARGDTPALSPQLIASVSNAFVSLMLSVKEALAEPPMIVFDGEPHPAKEFTKLRRDRCADRL